MRHLLSFGFDPRARFRLGFLSTLPQQASPFLQFVSSYQDNSSAVDGYSNLGLDGTTKSNSIKVSGSNANKRVVKN